MPKYNSRAVGVSSMIFAALFILAPLVVIALVSLASSESFEAFLAGGRVGSLTFPTLGAYRAIAQDPLYARAAVSSVAISSASALMAVVVAYPLAYVISQFRNPARSILAAAVLLPFWTSFLLRVYAWTILLSANGPLNQVVMELGITGQPLNLSHTNAAACVGIAYCYLPFAFLPIFASLVAVDSRLIEAAADLGAGRLARLVRIVLPLSYGGVITGFFLVFIPSLGEFVIPELLGGSRTLTFGRVLWTEFYSNHDWPIASALGVTLLLVIGIAVLLARRVGGTFKPR